MKSVPEIRYTEQQTSWLKQNGVPLLDGTPETYATHVGALHRLLDVGMRYPGTAMDWVIEQQTKFEVEAVEREYSLQLAQLNARQKAQTETIAATKDRIAAAFVPPRTFSTCSSPQRRTSFHSRN